MRAREEAIDPCDNGFKRLAGISAGQLDDALANGAGSIRLRGGTVVHLRRTKGRLTGATGIDRAGRALTAVKLRMRAVDGAGEDKCAVCVCNSDGGCKCIPLPNCPAKP